MDAARYRRCPASGGQSAQSSSAALWPQYGRRLSRRAVCDSRRQRFRDSRSEQLQQNFMISNSPENWTSYTWIWREHSLRWSKYLAMTGIPNTLLRKRYVLTSESSYLKFQLRSSLPPMRLKKDRQLESSSTFIRRLMNFLLGSDAKKLLTADRKMSGGGSKSSTDSSETKSDSLCSTPLPGASRFHCTMCGVFFPEWVSYSPDSLPLCSGNCVDAFNEMEEKHRAFIVSFWQRVQMPKNKSTET